MSPSGLVGVIWLWMFGLRIGPLLPWHVHSLESRLTELTSCLWRGLQRFSQACSLELGAVVVELVQCMLLALTSA